MKLHITILKYHAWYLCQIGLQIMLLPIQIYCEVLFLLEKTHVNTERVPPGHPIIPLKCNKFNMASVSVKRSISGILSFCLMVPLPPPPAPALETGMTNNRTYLTSSGINVRVISSSFFRFSFSLNNFSKTTKAINSRNFESFLGRVHRTTP